jgi:hypothetical protein
LERRNRLVVGITPVVEKILARIDILLPFGRVRVRREVCMVVAQIAERARASAAMNMGGIEREGTRRRVIGKSRGSQLIVVATMGMLFLGRSRGVEGRGREGRRIRHTTGTLGESGEVERRGLRSIIDIWVEG